MLKFTKSIVMDAEIFYDLSKLVWEGLKVILWFSTQIFWDSSDFYMQVISSFLIVFFNKAALVITSVLMILWLLLSVAFYTLVERKALAAAQRRQGPNLVGFEGLLQPLADGLKLLSKSVIIPFLSNSPIFLFAPVLTLFLSFLSWSIIPFSADYCFVDLQHGVLFLFVISSLGVHGVVLAGWSSNSRYAFLGAIRSAAQMVAYEVSMGFILLVIVLFSGSFNLIDIVLAQRAIWYVFPLFPLFVIFFISAVAETNRAPFDLPEAESELVAGYNVEYGSMTFAMFFLAEYANMLLMCALITIFFFGGWLSPVVILADSVFWFILKMLFFAFLYIAIRAALPRFRYDFLMQLGWMILLPLTFGFVFFYSSLLLVLDGFPVVFDFLGPFLQEQSSLNWKTYYYAYTNSEVLVFSTSDEVAHRLFLLKK